MDKAEERARQLYDCLKDAQEKGAWVERSQLIVIAQAIREAVEEEREVFVAALDAAAQELKGVKNTETGKALEMIAGMLDQIAAAIRARGKP